ncbi:hypothetical protein AAG570_002166 [Ranatra chinensis]|uniref:Tudor domain-containing protein n=1 Tax=Ranatra chinensis TaxID=642074 RepID=A0ABD0Y6P7_9HEMI
MATPDQQWTTNLLDFVHSSLVEKRCQVVLCIMSNEEGDQYGISSMRMPTGRDFIMQMVEEGHLKYTEVFMSLAEVSSTTDMLKDNDEDSEDNEAEVKDTSEEVIIESDEICMNTTEEGMKEESDAERTLYWVDLINQDSAGPITHYKHIVIHEDMDSLEVEMTAVLSVTQILVVITDSNHDSLNAMKVKFHEMMSVLQEEGPNQPKLEQPYLYQSCCVKFSDDQKWYRGIVVQELPECKLLIQYVDYGNVEIIPADQVHQLKEEWSSVEVQAMLINLNGIKVSCVDRIQVAKMMSECLLSNTLLARIKDRKGHGFNADLYIGEKLAYQDLIDNNCIEPISWYNESIGVH